MKPKNKAQHDAKMRAMREAGKAPSKPSHTVPQVGRLANLAHAKNKASNGAPWRSPSYFQDEMEASTGAMGPLLGIKLGIGNSHDLNLDPAKVAALTIDDLANHDLVTEFVDQVLGAVLEDRLKYRLKIGVLKQPEYDEELRIFRNQTAHLARKQYAEILLASMQREDGLA